MTARESEGQSTLFRDQLLDAVGQAVIALDTGGRITFWNAVATAMFGWSAEEVLGRRVSELGATPEGAAEWVAVLASVLSGGTWAGRLAVGHRDGSPCSGRVTANRLVDETGVAIGLAGVWADPGERVSTLTALRASEELFRRRFTAGPTPQAILSLDGVFTQVNPALCAMLARTGDEVVGFIGTDFIHPEDQAQAREEFIGIVTGRLATATTTRRYVSGDGGLRWGMASAVLVRDGFGAPANVAAFVHDVTAEHEARQAEAQAASELRLSEARFRALLHRSADVAIICDASARITYVSCAVTEVLGYHTADVIGRSSFEFVHPEDRPIAEAALGRALAATGPLQPFTIRLRAADGRYVWIEEAVTNSLDDPAVGGMILNLRDVSSRMVADGALAESERRYRSIVEAAEEGIWVLDGQWRTSFVNPRLAVLLGRPAEDLVGRVANEFVHPDDRELLAAHQQLRKQGEATRYEARLLRPDGEVVWVLVSTHPLLDADGGFCGAQAMLTDITDRKRMEEALRHNALHDELTGLANRTLLADRLEQMLTRQERHGGLGAVLFIDVDQFKLVNDSLGHNAGDTLIVEVASRIAGAARTDDTVARFGGDEFVVVCDALHDTREALDIAHRVLAAICEPIEVAGHRTAISASIGVACTPAETADVLLRDADSAMYLAKGRGRARVEVFDPAAQETARRELVLANELREALIAGDQLAVYYQPVVTVTGQWPVGVEALIRWAHPVRGLITPDLFVPLAERVGLIIELDRWVLRDACRQTAEWLREGLVPDAFTVAVNISASHLGDPTLVEHVSASLREFGLPASRLVIEVTETAFIGDTAMAEAALDSMREVGVAIALDDFGTGYSSLAYLKNIPADRLKIDRSFIGGLGHDGDDDAIVASIVSLADTLGLACIAEGVETGEQLLALTQLGCAFAQGYLWSRPVPADQLPATLATIPVFEISSGVLPGRDDG